MTALHGARVVTPDGVLENASIRVEGGTICSVESSDTTAAFDADWILPGFIDLHVHGGGGHDFTRSTEAMARGVGFHRTHGTTSTLVSLMTAPLDALAEQAGWVADLAADGLVLGAHLEGPFLSHARCGAQNPAHLLPADTAALAGLLEAGRGTVRTVTVAPELSGATELIKEIVAAGAVAAIGHTDADYDAAAAGLAAGATLATHLFNAMGRISQRAPGAAIAALNSDAYLELINDGVHVHDGLARLAHAAAPGRLVLITDAISATGVGDGDYTLGDRAVTVRDGQARIAGADSLAGSTLTMDAALRRAVHTLGLDVAEASSAASTTPARVLGIDDRVGAIAPGLAADLVLLDADLTVQRVMKAGRWC